MNRTAIEVSKAKETDKVTGKYMTFKLATEEYGVPISKVRELLAAMAVTRVPGTAEFLRGVINLRGKILPVLDLREKFGMGRTVPSDQSVIIVVAHSVEGIERAIGIFVDEALEVIAVDASNFERLPEVGATTFQTDLILGIVKSAERVVFLLDIDLALEREAAIPEPHSPALSK